VKPDVLAAANRLAERGEPFALATVVWARAPSSGKPGATALITPDRRVIGWIGGACAEPTVIREALRTLEDGTARLLFLGTADELAEHERDGVVTVPIACQSEGALEVYVEPVLPSPHIMVIGRSPAAEALANMALYLGWRSTVFELESPPDAGPILQRLPFTQAGIGSSSMVVVATQGHYDEDALQAALATPAAYVGLIASRKRAGSVLGYLRDRGVSEDDLARVHAPAGLDLGKVQPNEIAVAILAELVQLRAEGTLPAATAEHQERHEEIDPVCGMTVDVTDARFRTTHEGRTYYFCSAGCLATFTADPAAYVVSARNTGQ
jgi:xanthine dehydrogenase accessory factor